MNGNEKEKAKPVDAFLNSGANKQDSKEFRPNYSIVSPNNILNGDPSTKYLNTFSTPLSMTNNMLIDKSRQ